MTIRDHARSPARAPLRGILLLLPGLLLLACTGPTLLRFERESPHMGTTFRLVLYAPDAGMAAAAAEAAFARIAQLDGILSDWDPESELSRLARRSHESAPTAAIPVSDDLFFVLQAAVEIAAETGGAFDPTIGPLVRLWRRSRRQGELPSPERLSQARQATGWQHLELDPQRRTARLLARDMGLDLGGIAKGWALDEALAVLGQRGIDNALVDGGGDIAVRGSPPGADGWQIAIAPFEEGALAVRLSDAAVATSGGRYRFVEIDGTRYAHLIDPATGLGLTTRRASTVIAPRGWLADALASALVVGGEPLLERVTARPGVEAKLWSVENGAMRTCESRGFSRFIEGPRGFTPTAIEAASTRDPGSPE